MESVPMDEVPAPEVKRPSFGWLIALIFVLVGLSFGALLFIRYRSGRSPLPQVAETTKKAVPFSVVDMSPRNEVTLPEKVTFTFSEPVDPHEAWHFIESVPYIPGTTQQGSSPNEVNFIPNVPYPRGVKIAFRVGAGLKSSSGKMLASDYYSSFTTTLAENTIQFIYNNTAGRVLDFPAETSNTLKIQLGKDLRPEKLVFTLYQSDQANLLNYLLYEKKLNKPYPTYSYTTEEFLHQNLPHAKKIKDLKVNSDWTREEELNLPAGIYYLEATGSDGLAVGSTFIVSSNYGLSVRQDDQQMTLASFDVKTGQELTIPTYVGFYNLEQKPEKLSQTDFIGLKESYSVAFSTRVDAVIGTINGETVFAPLKIPQSLADLSVFTDLSKSVKIFLYTDRPIYKPGDTIRFRGVARMDQDAQYTLPKAGTPIRLWIDGMKQPVEQSVVTDAHGIFSGEFKAGEVQDQSPDYVSPVFLYARAGTKTEDYRETYSTYFSILPYTKPTFSLEITSEKEESLRSDEQVFTVRGKTFDGLPLANQPIKVETYAQDFYEVPREVVATNFNIQAQGMCGGGFDVWNEYFGSVVEKEKEYTLDAKGEATLRFKLPNTISGSQRFTVRAKRVEGSNTIQSAATTIIHQGSANFFFAPSADRYISGEEVVTPFSFENLDGTRQKNTDVSYSLAMVNYDTGSAKETELLSGSVRTDENGKGIVRFTAPTVKPYGSYNIRLKGKDASGHEMQNAKYVSFVEKRTDLQNTGWNKATQTYLRLSSEENSYLLGKTMTLHVTSPKSIDVLFTLERGRIYQPKIVHLQAGENTLTVPVTEELSPSITAVLSFFVDGAYYSEGLSLNVPAMHKVLTVSVASDKEIYEGTDSAKLTIKVTNPSGTGVPAQLSLAIVDKAIFALRKNATPPFHSTLFAFRPRTTTSTSSLTFIGTYLWGGGGGGGGAGLEGGIADTLYWNPTLATDDQGVAVIDVPLKSLKTTWKALVYASTDQTDVGQSDTEFIVR